MTLHIQTNKSHNTETHSLHCFTSHITSILVCMSKQSIPHRFMLHLWYENHTNTWTQAHKQFSSMHTSMVCMKTCSYFNLVGGFINTLGANSEQIYARTFTVALLLFMVGVGYSSTHICALSLPFSSYFHYLRSFNSTFSLIFCTVQNPHIHSSFNISFNTTCECK